MAVASEVNEALKVEAGAMGVAMARVKAAVKEAETAAAVASAARAAAKHPAIATPVAAMRARSTPMP